MQAVGKRVRKLEQDLVNPNLSEDNKTQIQLQIENIVTDSILSIEDPLEQLCAMAELDEYIQTKA